MSRPRARATRPWGDDVMAIQNTTYPGFQTRQDGGSDFGSVEAVGRRLLAMMGADTPVRVVAVNGVGLNPVGFVDVQPLVHMQDALGRSMAHGVIHNVPYVRMQGGKSAVICDPCVGDLGAVIICGRDISAAKASRAPAAPGSFRIHDMADAIYVAPILNATPEEYIWLTGNGVRVKTAGTFTVDAAGMQINCPVSTTGDITAGGTITGRTDVVAGTVSGRSHTHPVTGAPGTTGAPT
ncbi:MULTISPECIES: Gp138 family membrane-puncturing spike protein [Novacetimonas]|uniref:Baseplate assembly protein n=3 Tax=Novacetimonas hansenii TaxID=436 RepID=A0AAW5EXT2_NOVHA|nr:Gp138 family membrane-puncturing spike protein [Novacetimonas hansenii]EFG83030.1 phage baseplate assembly protein [Novacetimonas hansenii ATCC 23769]MCJ8355339.1 baseplate assembly protein [Novacetimonas hansenii]RFO99880.1 baseplate assembly protein [Novacetimonas hansenii]